MRLQIRSFTLLGILTCIAAASASEPAPLTFIADVPLSGSAVRFDYQSLDVANSRLYLAHMNADQLVSSTRRIALSSRPCPDFGINNSRFASPR
ncbi:MAG TPA: hypothetical protein VN682_02600 [Terriglobales bacterium]|nr:hypothetical protein [Terriglobales bacterium]HXF13603.1 hypothetical protein [Terriglobales bacterium]